MGVLKGDTRSVDNGSYNPYKRYFQPPVSKGDHHLRPPAACGLSLNYTLRQQARVALFGLLSPPLNFEAPEYMASVAYCDISGIFNVRAG